MKENAEFQSNLARIMIKVSYVVLMHSTNGGSENISTHSQPQRSTSLSGRFISDVRAAGTHSTGDWVEPRFGLRAFEKRNMSCCYWESNHSSSVPSLQS